jgi:hypothetical protein
VRAASQYGNGLARDVAFHHRVNGITESVEKSAETRGNHVAPAEAFQVDQVIARHDDIFGKRAVHVKSFDADVFADVPFACSALLATAATDVHLARDIIAYANKIAVNVFADFGHLAAEFVPDNDGLIATHISAVMNEHLVAHAWLLSNVINALIRAADRSSLDADFHVAVADARFRLVCDKPQAVFGEILFF